MSRRGRCDRGEAAPSVRRRSMKLPMIAAWCVALIAPCSLLAQEPIRDPLLRWMNQIAQHQLQKWQKEIDQIHAVAEAERRKQKVGAFTGLGPLLVAIGVFCVMAYSVSLQTHEIGIRMALAALGRDVLRMVLAKG